MQDADRIHSRAARSLDSKGLRVKTLPEPPGIRSLPKEPPDFDCRNPADVLRLRLRDWCWPTAAVIAVAIPFLGRSSGLTYQIGSLAYYANTYGLLVFLPAIFLAGLRWCWVGRLRPRDPNRCGHCNYRLDWMNAEPGPRHCPECGAAASGSTGRRRVPIARLLLDLPGILAMLLPIGLAVMLMLAMLGLLDLD